MIRYHTMMRAQHQGGGLPIVFDLTLITGMAGVTPRFPSLSRRLENVERNLREKRFGLRPTVEILLIVPHSQSINSLARYIQVTENVLTNPDAFIPGPGGSFQGWQSTNITATPNDTYAPDGTLTAYKMAATGSSPNFEQRASPGSSLFAHEGKTALFSIFLRADSPHPASIDIRANASPDKVVSVTVHPENNWKHFQVRNTFDLTLTTTRSSWAFVFPITAGSSGDVHFWRADMREIAALPGRDEQIISDLYDKLKSDAWDVEVTLNGGVTWRKVLLDTFENEPIAEKWVGQQFRIGLTCSEKVDNFEPTMDGWW